MLALDFPPLAAGEGLDRYPGEPARLRARMAELYGVGPEQVLPTRGAAHALELALRAVRLVGGTGVTGASSLLARLAAIHGLALTDRDPALRLLSSPSDPLGEVLTADEVRRLAAALSPGLLAVDESAIEFARGPSLAPLTAELPNLLVLRSLSLAYGLPGARCGAAVAAPALVRRLEAVLEPWALPGPTVAAAEAVLSPSRALAVAGRVRLVREERERLRLALQGAPAVREVVAGEGPFLFVLPAGDLGGALARYGVLAEAVPGGLRLAVGSPESNDRLLAAFGVAPVSSVRRRGEVVRDTRETRIAACVELDRPGPVTVRTGVGFYDHMLEQVAAHGGFSLRLACEGDLAIDAHHTVEDCAIAFGAALRQALGDRAGIGRFGFTAPMDEAEASVSLDLSGRPFAVFDGSFTAERIGDYPTALTAHVFRSLADSLGAAIHVRVTGADDHHKTEVCFKALGRALRQAVRLEGGGVPSTKGTLA